MKKLLLIFSVFIITMFWLGCQSKKEAIAYPAPATCDTSTVKYSSDIVPILQANCYSCHSNANANSSGGGYKLEGHSNLLPYAQFGSLVNAITRTVNSMPKGSPKMSDCNIAKIRTWVRNGYPNN
jgi:hypothetical protein